MYAFRHPSAVELIKNAISTIPTKSLFTVIRDKLNNTINFWLNLKHRRTFERLLLGGIWPPLIFCLNSDRKPNFCRSGVANIFAANHNLWPENFVATHFLRKINLYKTLHTKLNVLEFWFTHCGTEAQWQEKVDRKVERENLAYKLLQVQFRGW